MPTISQSLARTALRLYPFPRGQGRIIDRTFLSQIRFREERLRVQCQDGFSMWVAPNDLIGRHLYLTGQFDRTIVDVARSFCRGGERILDIGANIGYVSCALLHLVPDSRVVSVEPVPATFALLAQNVASVGQGRGRAINAAVSRCSGRGRMVLSLTNSGANRLTSGGQSADGVAHPSVDVPLIDGEELLRQSELDRVDFIKIDVEGHEVAVLEGLSGLLAAQRPRAIIFEHDGDLHDPQVVIRRVLDPLGYALHGLRKHLTKWQLMPLDDLCTRRLHCHDYVAIAGQGDA